jgi:two-component system, chemotaxis family, protein-glutamate methylesterase/glutaminase
MPRTLIVIGASAGGLRVLIDVVGRLQPDIPAAILVVVHLPPYHRSQLPELLSKAGPLRASAAQHGELLREGHIYVAPPDRHMVVRDDYIELNRGPRENRARPAIDPLFRTAARAYRANVAGVILSGMQGDGTVGLMAIKSQGGMTIVQDPVETEYSSMPERAIQYVGVDRIAKAQAIPAMLMEFARAPRPTALQPAANDFLIDAESRLIQEDLHRQSEGTRGGQVSTYSCPECGGTLWQMDEASAIVFHCHVGHTYSPEMLVIEKSESLETALWSAVRTLVERATLTRQLASRLGKAGREAESAALEEQARADDEHMVLIRDLILNATPNPAGVTSALQEAEANRAS